jgi:outer membrane protein assembly factor BamA
MWAALVLAVSLASGFSQTALAAHGLVAACPTDDAGIPSRFASLAASAFNRGRSSLEPETVTAIQVHGNTITSDDEIRRLAGIDIGEHLTETTLPEVAARLRATKRFEHVEVLKRFASITDASQVLIVIIVDEGAVHIERSDDPDRPPRVVRSSRLGLMFLPILGREDGYGITYGIRLARPDVAGRQSRLSFPLTWGGEKKAGIEIDKAVVHGPVDRITAGGSVSRRTNPFYDEDDDRARVWVRAERDLAPSLKLGATGGWQRVSFFDVQDRFAHAGLDIAVDTRIDPTLPRNAVYVRAALDHLTVDRGVTRSEVDAHGFLGLLGQTVLALRALRQDSNAPLPLYLKPLLGGMSSLRGFASGTAAGDTLIALSAELMVPLTSPLDVGRMGVSVFTDAGATYDKGARLANQTLNRGYGGSLWFTAAFLRLSIAVAHGHGSTTRVQVGFGTNLKL